MHPGFMIAPEGRLHLLTRSRGHHGVSLSGTAKERLVSVLRT